MHRGDGAVLVERGGDARGAATGGFAADAGIDHVIIETPLLQTLLQQRHPAVLLADAVGRRQTVTKHEYRGRRLCQRGTKQRNCNQKNSNPHE